MTLSRRDRAKVTAALVLLHDAGVDTAEVTRTAEILVNSGTPTRKAYDTAFTKFVQRSPSFRAPLQRLGQLIEASDDRTVASYNVALERYIATGDSSHLETVMPTVQKDMAAMAELTGDAGFAEGLGEVAAAPSTTPTPQAPPEAIGAASQASRPGHGPTGYSPSAVRSEASE